VALQDPPEEWEVGIMRARVATLGLAVALLAGGCQDRKEPTRSDEKEGPAKGTFSASAIAAPNAELSGTSTNERVEGRWAVLLTDEQNGYEITLALPGAGRPYSGIFAHRTFGVRITVTSETGTVTYAATSGELDITESDEEVVAGSFYLTAHDVEAGSSREMIVGGVFRVPCSVGCDTPTQRRTAR
jgi:hypothetical protein